MVESFKDDRTIREDLKGFGMTSTGFHIPKLQASYDFLADDLTKTLPETMRMVDVRATEAYARTQNKHAKFKEWLLENGAIFDDSIQYPAVFTGGLTGLAAKKQLNPY